MRHLSDGNLRRMYDEPLAVDAAAREHYATCAGCQARFAATAGAAREAAALLAVPGVTVDARAAYGRLTSRLRPGAQPAARRPFAGLGRFGWRRPALVGALAAVLVVAIGATPLASNLLKVFEPTRIQTVNIQNGDLNALAPLASYGDVKWTNQPELQQAADASAAATASGLPVINPGYLPAGVPQPSYGTVSQATGTFTFSSAKAAAAAAQSGQKLPPLPKNIDGSTLVLQIGPGEAAVYADLSKLRGAAEGGQAADPEAAVQSAGTAVAIAEMRSPKVSSTGVTLSTLKNYLLAQPGLSADARTAIEALDNPAGNLPIPIPADRTTSRQVTAGGVTYTVVGDNTGLGAGVVWIKGGIVYAVAGTVSADEALKVAENLH